MVEYRTLLKGNFRHLFTLKKLDYCQANQKLKTMNFSTLGIISNVTENFLNAAVRPCPIKVTLSFWKKLIWSDYFNFHSQLTSWMLSYQSRNCSTRTSLPFHHSCQMENIKSLFDSTMTMIITSLRSDLSALWKFTWTLKTGKSKIWWNNSLGWLHLIMMTYFKWWFTLHSLFQLSIHFQKI